MLTAKRAYNYLLDKGEFDNANLLEMKKFSPLAQGPGGLQTVNFSAQTNDEQRTSAASPDIEFAQTEQQQPTQQQSGQAGSPQEKRDWLVPQPDGGLQIKGPLHMRWEKPSGIVNGILGGVATATLPGIGAIPAWVVQIGAGAAAGDMLDKMDFSYPYLAWEPQQNQQPEQQESPQPPAPFEAGPNDGLT